MTKVDAIIKVMEDNNGLANWTIIYSEIGKYYPTIEKSFQWKAGIRGVLYREIKNKKNFKKINEGLFSLIEYDEKLLILNENMQDTETSSLIKVRKGQDKFRKQLLMQLKTKCPITNIDDRRLLIASHIKPWAFSSDYERLDTNNGFVLSVMFDNLFDKGLITFSFNKELIISSSLSNDNIKNIGIKNKQIIKELPLKNRENYLKYHHNKVFVG